MSYSLTSFSPVVAEQLVIAGLELSGKTDLRFIETVYKVLRDIFQYKPVLTKEQFLQWGFSQRKIAVICDIINLVLQKHNQNKKSKPKARFPASHKSVKIETISFADLENAVSARPIVVNHLENPSTIPVTTSHKETVYSDPVTVINAAHVERYASESPEHDIVELRGEEEEETAHNQCCVETEGRLSALEARLDGLISGMGRMSVLENRLEELENLKSKNEGQLITVPREMWENLLSRVLLLETKLELNSAKENVPPRHPPSPPPATASNVLLALQLPCVKGPTLKENDRPEALTLTEPDNQSDLKERLERITNMLKSTSSLLKNTDHNTTAYS